MLTRVIRHCIDRIWATWAVLEEEDKSAEGQESEEGKKMVRT